MPLKPQTLAFAFTLILGLILTVEASVAGWGLPHPERDPPSIREGSVRVTRGRRRARYFVGGGIHGGK